IEEPFKPVIRLVQPAYGADGKQGGMVVVNILGTPLLKYFEVRSRRFPVQYVALLNRDGYWLQGPVAKDLWGFMFPDRKGRSMAATKPELWQQIHDLAQVRARANGGVYLSDTFYPARLFGRRGLNVERSDERFWKLVAYYPDRYVKEALTDQYRLIALSSFGTGVALAIILLAMLRLRRQLELQRVSEERMRQQAMESERSKAVVTIAGGVAHEFNNILAGMLGSTYLLRSKLKGQPELGDSIDTIERLGRRAGDLVQRLMTYAQVDFREHKRLFLNDLVAEKMEEIRQGLAPDISLHVSIDDEPLPLKGDRSKLEKMLEHLISNAVDAVEKTGAPEIRVTLGPEGIDDKPASVGGNRYACLTIADNGSGIAKDILPLIFDPFFTTKEPGKGVGMGLALAWRCTGPARRNQG
ncbi:MAG TPA: ATP-binding protein, partial [Hyphomicrobiales bacterium]|nr:ATP-binding protein [Hyphomicrobiales bacterium]